eukprot:scaffold278531_cov35-Tisochrysis_lutea.AAC.3
MWSVCIQASTTQQMFMQDKGCAIGAIQYFLTLTLRFLSALVAVPSLSHIVRLLDVSGVKWDALPVPHGGTRVEDLT